MPTGLAAPGFCFLPMGLPDLSSLLSWDFFLQEGSVFSFMTVSHPMVLPSGSFSQIGGTTCHTRFLGFCVVTIFLDN